MNYFDVPIDTADYDKARVVILPVPYEATTSYGKGTSDGPAAMLKASAQVELYDEAIDQEPYRIGIHTLDPVDFHGLTGEHAMDLIATTLRPHLAAGKFPIVLGGEHSITSGVIQAVRERVPDVGVLQLDAHGDLRDTYEGSPWSHASVMRRLVAMGCPTVGVGIRSVCTEERDLIRARKLPRWFAHQVVGQSDWIGAAIAALPKRIFLTFDVDVFDASIMPSTGTPEPGGMTWYEILRFLQRVFQERDVVGMDIVELAPRSNENGPDFTVAKLLYKLIGYWSLQQK